MDRATKRFQKSGIFKTALLVSAALLGLLAFGAGPAQAAEGTTKYGLYKADNLVYACDDRGNPMEPAKAIDKKTVTDLFVEESVTTIESWAFENCKNLKNVTLPNTLEKISYSAFNNSGLTGIELPEGLTTIEGWAFTACEDLKEVTIPTTLTTWGDNAFRNSGLTKVELPEGLTIIGKTAFENCTGLKEIKIPVSLTTWGSHTFKGSGLTKVELPEGLTTIGRSAFENCKNLKNAIVPATVKTIENYAFYNSGLAGIELTEGLTTIRSSAFENCADLKEIKIPATVTEIRDYTFKGSGLTKVELPEGLKTIASYAFENCADLKEITVPATVTEIGYDSFKGSGLTKVELLEGLTKIGSGAFENCADLTTIKIPATVMEIGNYSFKGSGLTSIKLSEGLTAIGSRAFENCANLKEIKIPATVTTLGDLGDRDGYVFVGSGLTSVELSEGLTAIGSHAFENCANLKEIKIPASVANWGCDAFNGSGLTKVELPEGLTTIGRSAFENCKNLKNAILPATVKTIEDNAFKNSGLTKVELPEGLTTIGSYAFENCAGLKEITIPASLKTWGENAFRDCGLSKVELPDNLTAIGAGVFAGCGELKSIKIPATVTELGGAAFRDCGLTSVELPPGLTTINERLFEGCSALETVIWPDKLETIGKVAFAGCDALKEVVIPETVTTLDEAAFRNAGLTSIKLPTDLKIIRPELLRGCKNLRSITIPPTVTMIDSYAFMACKRLTRMVLSSETPPELGSAVFGDGVPRTRYMVLTGAAATSEAYEGGWSGFTKTKALGTDVTPSITDQTYRGRAIEPGIDGINGSRYNDYNVTYENNTNLGTATAHITTEGCYGMYTGSADVSFTINPAPLTIRDGAIATKPYDGSPEAAVESVTFNGLQNWEALEKDTDYKATAAFTDANAGTDKEATITVVLEKTDKTANYILEGPNTIGVRSAITPAPGSGQVSQEGWTYGQPGVSPAAESETNGTENVTYAYKQKDAGDNTYTAEVPKSAGSYTLQATFAATQNYEAVTAAADFTIAPAVPIVTITPDWVKEIQVGEPITLSIALKGVKDEQPRGTVAILGQTLELKDGQAALVYTPVNDAPKTLTAEYTPAEGESYTSAQNSITLKASRKTREPITLEDLTKTYGDPAFTLAPAGGSLQEGESYQYASDNEAVVAVGQNGEVTLRQTGTANITVSVDESSAWNPTAATMALTVNKANPAYETPENLTAVYGQILKEVTLPPGFTWQTAKDTAVGNVGSNPFKVMYTPDDKVNYNSIRDIEVHITVTPGPGTGQVSQEGWTYGQPALSPVPESKTNGTENVTYAYKTKDAGDDTYTAEVPKSAGGYTLQATFAAIQNYAAVTATADFTIAPAVPIVTITPETGKGIQVGEPVTLNIALKGVKEEQPKGTVEILGQTLELKDGQVSITYTPADSTPKTLTAQYTPAEGENYTGAKASIELTAGKKTREPITLEDITKTYGDPAFTLTPAGGSLQDGEAYTYTSDNEAVAAVGQNGEVTLRQTGTAHIIVSVAESSAWKPAAATMTLTVGKAQITGVTFEDATYTEDGAEHKIELTGSLPEGASVSYENNVQKAPGTYTAKAIIEGGVNYESLELTATLTIKRKRLKTPEEISQAIAELPDASGLGSLTEEEQTQVRETVENIIESIAGLPPEQQLQIPQDDIIRLEQYGASPYNLVIDKDTSATTGHETHIDEADVQIFGGSIAARAMDGDVKIVLTQELPPDGAALAIRLKLYIRQEDSAEYTEAELKTPIVVQLRLPGHIKTQGLGIRHLNPDGSVKENLVPAIKGSQASFMTASFSRFLFVEASGLEPGPEEPTPGPEEPATGPEEPATGPEEPTLGTGVAKSHNTNTGLPVTGSKAAAAALLALAVLIGLAAWQYARKHHE